MSFTTLGRVSCWPHCGCVHAKSRVIRITPRRRPTARPAEAPCKPGQAVGGHRGRGWPAQAPRTSASPHEELVLPGTVPTGVSESGRVGATSLYLTQPIN